MDNTLIIDDARTVCLCAAGQPDYIAATAIGTDGEARLVLAQVDAINDASTRYDPTCAAVTHEQLGSLPLEFVHRLTISRRTHRCGRPTKAGTPCQTPVAHAGAACGWHRTTTTKEAKR